MNTNDIPIQWPAIIQYHNDAELDYIENEQQWLSQADWHQGEFEQQDRLIDAEGHVFRLNSSEQRVIIPTATGQHASLEEILGLVKAHLADQGSCCVAKTYAPSIRLAIAMIKP